MSGRQLEVEDRGNGIWLLRLNRPKERNALSISLRDEISRMVDLLAANQDVRVLVLTGAGTVFSSGFDLHEFESAATDPDVDALLWASSDRFHHTILRCPVPLICALNGPALAGGFDLAVLCDLRIAQEGVWFSRPEVNFGIPMFGPLRELVGGAMARELCLTSRRVELDEASRIGLVNTVADPGKAEEAAMVWAAEIASRPSHLVRATKAKIVNSVSFAARPTLAL